MTHAGEPAAERSRDSEQAIQPAVEQDRLGCVLAQFPWSFKNTPENHDKLRRFKDMAGDSRPWSSSATSTG